MKNIPQPGQIYRHFKGNLYRIVTLAKHSETGEMLVIYQALYGEYRVYARPLSMFMEKMDKEKYPDAAEEFRFTLLKELIESPAAEQPMGEADKTFVSEKAADAETAESIGMKEVLAGETAESFQTEGKSNEEAGGFGVEEASAESEEEINLDPLVIEFLDADTYEERLNILSALRDRITNDMINIMAITVGVEIKEGDVERRYDELRSCLLTFGRYESNRLR